MKKHRTINCPKCKRSMVIDYYGEDDRDNYIEFQCYGCNNFLYFYNSKDYGLLKRYYKYIKLENDNIDFTRYGSYDVDLTNNVFKSNDKIVDGILFEDVTNKIDRKKLNCYSKLSNYSTIMNKLQNRDYGHISEKCVVLSGNSYFSYNIKFYGSDEISCIYIAENHIIIELEHNSELNLFNIVKEFIS